MPLRHARPPQPTTARVFTTGVQPGFSARCSAGALLRRDSRADLPPARSAALRQTAAPQVEQVSHYVASAQPEGCGNLVHAAVGARTQVIPDPALSFGQLIQRAGGGSPVPFALVLGAQLKTRGGISVSVCASPSRSRRFVPTEFGELICPGTAQRVRPISIA